MDYLCIMIHAIKIGTKKVLLFKDLKSLCEKMKWNYKYLKKKDLSAILEFNGYFICEK